VLRSSLHVLARRVQVQILVVPFPNDGRGDGLLELVLKRRRQLRRGIDLVRLPGLKRAGLPVGVLHTPWQSSQLVPAIQSL
jgi:hypothetical protein